MFIQLNRGNTDMGLPIGQYRHPDEISRDINKMKERISAISERLNIRCVITEAIDGLAHGSPEVWIPSLKALTQDAEEMLGGMKRLLAEIDLLRDELEETRCALTI